MRRRCPTTARRASSRVAAALYAGLRRGELRALRVSNLRGLDGNEVAAISVEHGWDDKEGERATNSTACVREIPMPETLCTIIAAHIERLELRRRSRVRAAEVTRQAVHSPPICPRPGADDAWASAKLRRVTLHECRHGNRSFLDAPESPKRARRSLPRARVDIGGQTRRHAIGQLADDAKRVDESRRPRGREVCCSRLVRGLVRRTSRPRS